MSITELEKRYVLLLQQLKDFSEGSLIKEVTELKKEAEALSLPSLNFAADQLLYLKQRGVSAINVGGTMGGGKSSVGEALANKLGWEFVDADEFHPDANIEKQRKGIPLTTEDRIPFLKAVREFLRSKPNRISTCSALKSEYRAVLAGQSADSIDRLWDIKEPYYGLLQLIVYKPYEVALTQLDLQTTGSTQKRLFRGKPHFINVTRESEESAKSKGEFGILAKQYHDLENPGAYAWEAIRIDVEDYLLSPGNYDVSKMIQVVLRIVK